MLLLATSLVGLAAMANAAYITSSPDKEPPVGYTSGNIDVMDGKTGTFHWDLNAYNAVNYPVWGGTWQRMLAIEVQKDATGKSLADSGLQVRYTSLAGGAEGDVWHVSPNDLDNPYETLWWCGVVSSAPGIGLDMDITMPLELSLTADCTGTQVPPCSLGVGVTATAWFYQISDSWVSSAQYDTTYQPVGNSDGSVVGGWTENACFGSPWTNVNPTDVNSGNVAIDTAFNPTDTEGFSANWETLAFNDKVASEGVPPYIRLFDQALATGEVYPTIATWVERGSAGPSEMLYATLRVDTGDVPAQGYKYMLCVSSAQGAVWSDNGNAPATVDLSTCNLGCYPNSDCSTSALPMGGFDMEGYAVTGQDAVYVTVLIAGDAGTSDGAWAQPGISVAYAWGHLPSAAMAFAPSLLLGVLALAAATQA